jgi:hypothetical protein
VFWCIVYISTEYDFCAALVLDLVLYWSGVSDDWGCTVIGDSSQVIRLLYVNQHCILLIIIHNH